MKIFKQLIIAFLFLLLAVLLSSFLEESLRMLVSFTKISWVLSSYILRGMVILFVFLSLKFFFKNWPKIKWPLVLIISIPLGIGVSFITPIYSTDYGLLDDRFTLENIEALEIGTNQEFKFQQETCVIAFFTTTCPHCMNASEKLGINISNGMQIPVHAFFPGNREDTDRFLVENNGEKMNSYLIGNQSLFVSLSGGLFPSIFVIDPDGKTMLHWTGDEMNYTALDYLNSLPKN